MSSIRIAYLGGMAFSIPSLRALARDSRFTIGLAACPAERPNGRGMKVRPSPFATACAEQNLICERIAHPGDLDSALENTNVDFAVVCAFGMKLTARSLEAPTKACINIHASLLPRWRGAAPIERTLIAGDERTGVSLIEMAERIDRGPILASMSVLINAQDTAGALHGKLSELGASLIGETIVNYEKLTPVMQDASLALHAKKISKEEAQLCWREPAQLLERKVRAFNPRPGAYFKIAGKRIKLLTARVSERQGEPGCVLALTKTMLCVGCGEGSLELGQVVPAGSKPMDVASWLCGLRSQPQLGKLLDED